MGESKRRKQILGNQYGIVDINAQLETIWSCINTAIASSQEQQADYLFIQCSNQDKGFHYDAIKLAQKQLESWECPLQIPVLIQALPQGFKPSKTKLFDGFVPLWCNRPDFQLWKNILATHIQNVKNS